jgi:hypothetical protein
MPKKRKGDTVRITSARRHKKHKLAMCTGPAILNFQSPFLNFTETAQTAINAYMACTQEWREKIRDAKCMSELAMKPNRQRPGPVVMSAAGECTPQA